MKGKRLLASMLALLLVVSLLPMAAMADDLPDNSVGQVPINQPIGTNSGTGVDIKTNGSVQTNSGSVAENQGTVVNNNGTVAGNMAGGTVENNNAGATVQYNYAGATVENNNAGAAVNNNYGLVGKKDENGNPITDGSSGNSGNSGTVVYNMEGGIVTNNTGTVENNMAGGTVMRNSAGGTVENNNAGATVKVNHGLVGQKDENGNLITDGSYGNFGTVENNKKGGIVTNNTGTVENNMTGGTVMRNSAGGTVENNNAGATVIDNYGLVGKDENGNLITDGSSGNFGNVQNNMKGGTVVNNGGGTVVNNNAGGIVENNGGTVVNNNAGGAVANNAGGKVENNSGTVFNEGGTVAINNPRGYVYGDDKESIGTNYGTRVLWNGDVSSSPVYFYGVHFVNDKDEMVYLGDYKNGPDVKLEQLQENCKGYKIYGILAVEEYNKGADDFIQRGPVANESNPIPSFTINKPTRLKLLWEKIVSVVKPASNEPEAKPVKAAALPSTVAAEDVKVGTVVRVKGQLFRVIEMDDASMTVVTMGKLSGKDMEDPMAFLAKYFTPEQLELLLGDPELISGALAEELFGGNTGHIVFKAARNLFA